MEEITAANNPEETVTESPENGNNLQMPVKMQTVHFMIPTVNIIVRAVRNSSSAPAVSRMRWSPATARTPIYWMSTTN